MVSHSSGITDYIRLLYKATIYHLFIDNHSGGLFRFKILFLPDLITDCRLSHCSSAGHFYLAYTDRHSLSLSARLHDVLHAAVLTPYLESRCLLSSLPQRF